MRKILLLAAAIAAIIGTALSVQAQPYGPGIMGGSGPGYRMMDGYGHGWMMGPGYGPGYMMRGGYGPMMGGYGSGYEQGNLNLTTDNVKDYLQRMLAIGGNPNIKVGEVKEKDADTIEADIVTKDSSLVQRFVVNRHSGFYRPQEN